MKTFLTLVLIAISLNACTPDFQHSHYRKRTIVPHKQWKRRPVSVFKSGTWVNPLIKREYREEITRPRVISLDRW
jgi:hypothetical protein